MQFAVFWRISVRFCGFRTLLTPPSIYDEHILQDIFGHSFVTNDFSLAEYEAQLDKKRHWPSYFKRFKLQQKANRNLESDPFYHLLKKALNKSAMIA